MFSLLIYVAVIWQICGLFQRNRLRQRDQKVRKLVDWRFWCVVSVVWAALLGVILALCPWAIVVFFVMFLAGLCWLLYGRRWAILSVTALLLPISAFIALVIEFCGAENSSLVFELIRVTNFSNGVSPFVAVVCLTIALILCGRTQIKLHRIRHDFQTSNPLSVDGSFSDIAETDSAIYAALAAPLTTLGPRLWPLVVVFVLCCSMLGFSVRLIPSTEGPVFDCLYVSGFALTVFVVVFAAMHFLVVFALVGKLLRQLAAFPWSVPLIDCRPRFPSCSVDI